MQGHDRPSGDVAFPLTEDGLAGAFALVEEGQAAREHARGALRGVAPDSAFAEGRQPPLLLCIGSLSARMKINSLRVRRLLHDAPGGLS